ncbi:MAG: hypothetical protein AB7N65_18500 [Vicinamibacterales bacterium]
MRRDSAGVQNRVARFCLVMGVVLLQAGSAWAQESAWGPNGYISINGIYETTRRTTEIDTTEEINQETATITSVQEVGRRPLLDVTVGGRVRGNVGLGFGISYGVADDGATLTGDIPHPFYFDQPRSLNAPTTFDRSDLMLHIHPMWLIPIAPRLQATLFGGATWFQVRQQTVRTITVNDTYPYDDVSLGTVERERQTKSGWGYNAGFDVSYFFSRYVGVQGLVRYSHGTVTFNPGGVDSDVTVGGLHAGAGLRIRY